VVHPELVEAAASRQAVVSEKKALEARMIRVHADKLDQLIDLVGEMVIAGAGANLLAQRSGQSELMESTSVLLRLVEDIRDSALQLRMVQIGETFNRFNRVVRDSSREMGKAIDLVITGAETELDKSVVEKLGDPLMHLVRNAIDHGIEAPPLRAARGKPENGTVQLNAYHDSGSIIIEVIDDGGGLPKEKIRQKAIDKGLIDAAATLSDQEIINLIFEAGFSTADQVTNISGRGVGMDVVRRNIQSLRGSVEVEHGRRRRIDLHHPPAADAGDHRRLPDRRRQGVLRRAARLGRRMHRTRRRSREPQLPQPARRGAALRPPARAVRNRRRGAPAARTWSSSSTPARRLGWSSIRCSANSRR
jgi:two-component system chemotaxis sensor kinase CheA